jgi:hypothetical protein
MVVVGVVVGICVTVGGVALGVAVGNTGVGTRAGAGDVVAVGSMIAGIAVAVGIPGVLTAVISASVGFSTIDGSSELQATSRSSAVKARSTVLRTFIFSTTGKYMGFEIMAQINIEVTIDYTHYVCEFYSGVGNCRTDVAETRIISVATSGVKGRHP